MGLTYQWRELEMVSVTTVTNIVTFIQFAIIPLDKAKQSNENFTSTDLSILTNIFISPFDLIKAFFEICVPMRVLISAVIIIGILNLLILSFFFPAWRLILFMFDIFMPGIGLFGSMFLVQGYEAQKTVGIICAVIGWIYTIGRIVVSLVPQIRNHKHPNWDQRCARITTAIFLSRLTKTRSEEELNDMEASLIKSIRDHDNAINIHVYTKKNRIIDICVSSALLLITVILYSLGWKNMITAQYSGIQLNQLSYIADCITIVFIVFFAFRVIMAVFVFISDSIGTQRSEKTRNIFLTLRRWAFKGIIIVTGFVLLPVVKMILQSTETKAVTCPYGEYYDTQSNLENFLDYFMERKNAVVGCVNCSPQSWQIPDCLTRCSSDGNEYKVNSAAPYISENELTSAYMIPITILEIFFLLILIQLQRSMFSNIKQIVCLLPAPTTSINIKFASLCHLFKSSGAYVFDSYNYEQALFNFDFTQVKTFILYFSSLFPVFPEESVRPHANKIICCIFTVSCFIIAGCNVFLSPYKSKLHNTNNTVSYFVGAIASLVAALALFGLKMNSLFVDIMHYLIFIVPIATCLIAPIFIRYDPQKRPIPYTYHAMSKKQKWVDNERRIKKKGLKRQNIDFSSSSSASSESKSKKKAKEEKDYEHPEFETRFFCPILVQESLDKKSKKSSINLGSVRYIWKQTDTSSQKLARATNSMREAADEILDAISYQRLKRILNISTIVVSMCLGWGLGAAVARWKTHNEYIKCNWQVPYSEIPDQYKY